jgi:hypothetical protein
LPHWPVHPLLHGESAQDFNGLLDAFRDEVEPHGGGRPYGQPVVHERSQFGFRRTKPIRVSPNEPNSRRTNPIFGFRRTKTITSREDGSDS